MFNMLFLCHPQPFISVDLQKLFRFWCDHFKPFNSKENNRSDNKSGPTLTPLRSFLSWSFGQMKWLWKQDERRVTFNFSNCTDGKNSCRRRSWLWVLVGVFFFFWRLYCLFLPSSVLKTGMVPHWWLHLGPKSEGGSFVFLWSLGLATNLILA